MSATARKEELKTKLALLEAQTRPLEEELARIHAEEETKAMQKEEERITELDTQIAALMAERDALRPLSVYIRKVKGAGWKSRKDSAKYAEYNKRAMLSDKALDEKYKEFGHGDIKRILFLRETDEYESDPFC